MARRDASGHLSEERRARLQRVRHENRLLVRELKVARGCERCGFAEDPERLHLHHRDPASKTHPISYMVRWGTARLMEEVAKCDVLCWDCHMLDHHPGMGKPVVSLRIEPEVLAWIDAYAKQRGSSRTAVVDAALASFREDAARGVPDLRPKSGGAPLGPVRTTHRKPAVRKKAVLAPPPFARPMGAMERQAKLNEAKERAR